MSEYWKSTPRYWCKHCKVHVRDTPLEKRNHEASPRHQGNLSKFVRDLHRSNEREAREAQRAKDEVARLNGTLGKSSSAAAAPALAGGSASRPTFAPKSTQKATPEERRRQMAQLAALGVAVPDGFRRDNAMAGDWEVVNSKIVEESTQVKEDEEEKDSKATLEDEDEEKGPLGSVKFSMKRQRDDDEEGGPARKGKKKPNWGSDVKKLPSAGVDEDLDALLGATTTVKGKKGKEAEDSVKTEEGEAEGDAEARPEPSQIESEEKPEDEPDVGAIFKKRKHKPMKR